MDEKTKMAIYSTFVRGASAVVAGAAWLVPPLRGRLDGGVYARVRAEPPDLEPAPNGRIWIHAVSAGEVKAARVLVSALARLAPKTKIVLSSATDSGFEATSRVEGLEARIRLPIDTVEAIERLNDRIKPDALVVMESELWPALFAITATHNVPIFIVNGRMSEKSAHTHQRWPFVVNRSLRLATRVFTEDEASLERLISVGANPNRLEVGGNIKLALPGEVRPNLRKRPPGGPLIVAFGNVHPGELRLVADVIDRVARTDRSKRFYVVPRHPENFNAAMVKRALGGGVDFITEMPKIEPLVPVTWVNAMGTLAGLYRRSDIGVVCGTFSDIGGHDITEPYHCGAVSIYGPDIRKQGPLHDALVGCDCALQVEDAYALAKTIERLAARPADRAAYVDRFAWRASAAMTSVDRIAVAILSRVHFYRPKI
jgi:3-deoxy-D-manno-octulosonic-acid transferase